MLVKKPRRQIACLTPLKRIFKSVIINCPLKGYTELVRPCLSNWNILPRSGISYMVFKGTVSIRDRIGATSGRTVQPRSRRKSPGNEVGHSGH